MTSEPGAQPDATRAAATTTADAAPPPLELSEAALEALLFVAGRPPSRRQRATAIGGGRAEVVARTLNLAAHAVRRDAFIDAARTALRLGARRVQLVSLETREQMPAHPDEVRESEEEGITLQPGRGPKALLGQDGHVVGVEGVPQAEHEAQSQSRPNWKSVGQGVKEVFQNRPSVPGMMFAQQFRDALEGALQRATDGGQHQPGPQRRYHPEEAAQPHHRHDGDVRAEARRQQ